MRKIKEEQIRISGDCYLTFTSEGGTTGGYCYVEYYPDYPYCPHYCYPEYLPYYYQLKKVV